jgi:hypothetical protein
MAGAVLIAALLVSYGHTTGGGGGNTGGGSGCDTTTWWPAGNVSYNPGAGFSDDVVSVSEAWGTCRLNVLKNDPFLSAFEINFAWGGSARDVYYSTPRFYCSAWSDMPDFYDDCYTSYLFETDVFVPGGPGSFNVQLFNPNQYYTSKVSFHKDSQETIGKYQPSVFNHERIHCRVRDLLTCGLSDPEKALNPDLNQAAMNIQYGYFSSYNY